MLKRLGTMTKTVQAEVAKAAEDFSFCVVGTADGAEAGARAKAAGTKTGIATATVSKRKLLAVHIIFRTLAACAALSASIVMGTNRQRIMLLEGSSLEANFSYSPSFSYLLAVNVMACVYAVLTALMAAWFCRRRLARPGFVLFALDLIKPKILNHPCLQTQIVMVALMSSAATSALEIANVGRKGQAQMGWLPICKQFGRFCHHVGGTLLVSYAVLLFFFLLTIASLLTFYTNLPSD